MLIAVIGKKQHGKSTIGNWLNARYGLVQDAFARLLKEAARDWFDLSEEQVEGSLKEVVDPRWALTPREIMQRLGTEVGRSIHPDVWVLAAMRRHRGRLPYRAGSVITDCRFPNEARIVRENGGILIYVVRPGLKDNEFSDHDSERFIEEIGKEADHELINDGSVEDLQDDLSLLLRDD